jgi:hypothetical protein
LSENFRDRPTDVGIVVGQRHVHSLREHQGRADLEHRVRGHIEEKLIRARGLRGQERPGSRSLSMWRAMPALEATKCRGSGSREPEIDIAEVVERWLAPDHRYFKVRDVNADPELDVSDVDSRSTDGDRTSLCVRDPRSRFLRRQKRFKARVLGCGATSAAVVAGDMAR